MFVQLSRDFNFQEINITFTDYLTKQTFDWNLIHVKRCHFCIDESTSKEEIDLLKENPKAGKKMLFLELDCDNRNLQILSELKSHLYNRESTVVSIGLEETPRMFNFVSNSVTFESMIRLYFEEVIPNDYGGIVDEAARRKEELKNWKESVLGSSTGGEALPSEYDSESSRR